MHCPDVAPLTIAAVVIDWPLAEALVMVTLKDGGVEGVLRVLTWDELLVLLLRVLLAVLSLLLPAE